MLLRSNYDYIDHDYWPSVYAGSKAKWERLEAKYGVKAKPLTPHQFSETERKHLEEQGIGKHHSIPQTKDEPLYRIPIITENDSK